MKLDLKTKKQKPFKGVRFFLILFALLSVNLSAKHFNEASSKIQQALEISIQKQISIKNLFKLIAKETEYSFFYSDGLKDLNQMVNLHVKNAKVERVLQIAFNNLALEYRIKGTRVLVRNRIIKKVRTKPVQNKPPTITGIVKDDEGNPLPGVNIVIKGTKKGTTTDFDGEFTIEAKPTDFIVFSYMGFKTQTVKVGNKVFFDIKMITSDNMLDEVIIAGVASGTSKKKMSVSVAKVKSDDITKVPQSSLAESLSGKMAGVSITSTTGSPGGTKSIVLRGAKNLSGSNSPMIIIDGIISKGSLSDINAEDMESIEVVKGAAAASLYGSDAGNGVIVITSKRGKKMKVGQTAINLRSRIEVQQIAKYLHFSNLLYH
jgi:TonB-dependent SusC/RagA subfamily outer membrane receptor